MRVNHVGHHKIRCASAALLSSLALLLVAGCDPVTAVKRDSGSDLNISNSEPAQTIEEEPAEETDPPAEPGPEPEPEPDPEPEPNDPPDGGLPTVSLSRLEPSGRVAVGQPLQVWVRIDRDPDQALTGGVIFSDSATGNHWHAFVFRPGGPREKQAAPYHPPVVREVPAHRTVTVRVNDVFDGYDANVATMSVDVVPR